MNDVRVGSVLRAIRIRSGLRQADVANMAQVSQSRVSNAERGRLGSMSVDAVRRVGGALGVRIELSPYWRGGEFDRLLDQGHATLGERVVGVLRSFGFDVLLEYSFDYFGDRGSVDIVGWHARTRTLLLVELKTRVFDLQDLLSSSHRKARIVPGLLESERGWPTKYLGRVLAMSDTHANRSLVQRYAATFDATFPARTVAIRRWLGEPSGALAGVWFLANIGGANGKSQGGTSRRVRGRNSGSRAASARVNRE